jgi:hypothetical protein
MQIDKLKVSPRSFSHCAFIKTRVSLLKKILRGDLGNLHIQEKDAGVAHGVTDLGLKKKRKSKSRMHKKNYHWQIVK